VRFSQIALSEVAPLDDVWASSRCWILRHSAQNHQGRHARWTRSSPVTLRERMPGSPIRRRAVKGLRRASMNRETRHLRSMRWSATRAVASQINGKMGA